MPQDIKNNNNKQTKKNHDFEYVFLFIQCVHWYISNNYLSSCSLFKQYLSVVVTVGKQVLKTSSSGNTGLYEALIEQTSTQTKQTDREEDRQTYSCTTSPIVNTSIAYVLMYHFFSKTCTA